MLSESCLLLFALHDLKEVVIDVLGPMAAKYYTAVCLFVRCEQLIGVHPGPSLVRLKPTPCSMHLRSEFVRISYMDCASSWCTQSRGASARNNETLRSLSSLKSTPENP